MKYKNISNQRLSISGVGEFKPGEIKEVSFEINNPNFELINTFIENEGIFLESDLESDLEIREEKPKKLKKL